jgi:hypothetical protein
LALKSKLLMTDQYALNTGPQICYTRVHAAILSV